MCQMLADRPEAKNCCPAPQPKRTRFDPLTPRGNRGEADLPQNRPRVARIFIPETMPMRQNANELNSAIVIDARLRPSHSLHILQSVVMATCNSEYPLPITHMVGPQYLLILPMGQDRHRFLLNFTKPLQDLGFITYPWSPAINAYPSRLKFKVWLELRRMSPLAWCLEHLIAAISSFGVVLEHSTMSRVHSLESMLAVIAVPDLALIPHAIEMWIRGHSRDIDVVVLSWIEEPLPFIPALDPTPSEQQFNKIKEENLNAMRGFPAEQGTGELAINFDILVSVWVNLKEGQKKKQIEEILKKSPLFIPYLENEEKNEGIGLYNTNWRFSVECRRRLKAIGKREGQR